MKKIIFFAALLMLFQAAFAGGLLTNTNQSAQFIRMMSRNASLGIDGVYFNPAGLTQMEDGWHFALHSQSIFQTKTVDSKFPLLSHDGLYEAEVTVPVFPSGFAVYKMENWAFSLGFGPNAGGGSADYSKGLPSLEIPISKVVPGLAGLSQIDPALAVSGYDADLSFEGSSVFWGIQLGATYQLNEMLSVYGGARYLPATNVYQGTIENIQLKVNDQFFPAPAWLLTAAGGVSGMASDAGDAAATVDPIIQNGGGGFTLNQLEMAGEIDAASRARLEAALTSVGVTPTGDLTIQEIQQTFLSVESQLQGTANLLSATAGQLENKELDTEQTGTGITPMVGLNISPSENWNIGVKYEMKTNLQVTNNTTVDDLGLFPDEGTDREDLPAILGVGLGYQSRMVEAQLSYNMYFNKNVGWGPNLRDVAAAHPTIREREIEKNGIELGLGAQFNVSDNFAFSLGGLYGDMGVAESYQSDLSYSNPSISAGAGIEWMVADGLVLDAGVSNTFYKDQTVSFTDPDVGEYSETLGKSTMTFAIGLSYSLF